MSKIGYIFLLCISATVCAQDKTPTLLLRATQCLAAKQFLPRASVPQPSFGYWIDETSYPGNKILYIIEYAAPARSNGWVYTVITRQEGEFEAFDIQNNARFALSKKGDYGVDFVEPPLGGNWTQEHLASAIKRIEAQPRFTILEKDLHIVAPSGRCESYTDH